MAKVTMALVANCTRLLVLPIQNVRLCTRIRKAPKTTAASSTASTNRSSPSHEKDPETA